MLDRLSSASPDADTEPRVVPIDSEPATALLEAISAKTARDIVASLHDEPKPPSEVAAAVDTSLANVNYHIEKLTEAGVVAGVDTRYSSKGKEMTVYAATEDPLVFAGTEPRSAVLGSLLRTVSVALVGLLAASGAVQWLVAGRLDAPLRKATSAGVADPAPALPLAPGLLFFAGGSFVLAVTVAVRYALARRGV